MDRAHQEALLSVLELAEVPARRTGRGSAPSTIQSPRSERRPLLWELVRPVECSAHPRQPHEPSHLPSPFHSVQTNR